MEEVIEYHYVIFTDSETNKKKFIVLEGYIPEGMREEVSKRFGGLEIHKGDYETVKLMYDECPFEALWYTQELLDS
jgi:hypothetical protein